MTVQSHLDFLEEILLPEAARLPVRKVDESTRRPRSIETREEVRAFPSFSLFNVKLSFASSHSLHSLSPSFFLNLSISSASKNSSSSTDNVCHGDLRPLLPPRGLSVHSIPSVRHNTQLTEPPFVPRLGSDQFALVGHTRQRMHSHNYKLARTLIPPLTLPRSLSTPPRSVSRPTWPVCFSQLAQNRWCQ